MKKQFFFCGLAMVMLIGCKHDKSEENLQPEFKVSAPLQSDTTIYKEYVCQIRAYQHIELRALEKGYLENIYIDEGQFVKKGQLLFQILPYVYQAEVQKAEAELEYAKVNYNNTKALAEKNIVSQNELALVKAELLKAEAELQLTKTHLKFTEIRAPFDGIIGKFEDVRLGSLLDEGELLTTLTDNSKMWVYFNVPEAEYLEYDNSKDDSDKYVLLKLANNTIYKEKGKITAIESDFNNKTGNIAFRATFPNPDRVLRHGQTGDILWPVKIKNAIMIPQRSTYDVLDKKFVFLVDKTGLVKSRQIEVEGELEHIYLIKKGIKPSERYLLEGLRKVRSGEKIKYKYISPEKVFKNLNLHAE